jgi:hypothetical protein
LRVSIPQGCCCSTAFSSSEETQPSAAQLQAVAQTMKTNRAVTRPLLGVPVRDPLA